MGFSGRGEHGWFSRLSLLQGDTLGCGFGGGAFGTIAVDRGSGGYIATDAGDVDGALWNDEQVVSVNVNEWGVRVKYSSGSVTMARGSGRRG